MCEEIKKNKELSEKELEKVCGASAETVPTVMPILILKHQTAKEEND